MAMKDKIFSKLISKEDMKNEVLNYIRNIVSYLPVIGLVCLSSSILFTYGPYQRISLFIFAFAYPLDYICNLRWKQWQWDRNKIVYVLFIAFFLLIPIWHLFDAQYTPILQDTIEKFIPFLFIGICGIMGMTDKFKMEYIVYAMLLTSVGVIVFILTLVGMPNPDSLNHWVDAFNIKSHEYINTHMVLNLYWNLSIILGLYFLWHSRSRKLWKVLVFICMVPICISLCMTDGRTGTLTFIGTIFFVMLYCISVYRKWWMMGILFGFIIGSCTFLMQRHRFVAATHEKDTRVYIWDVSIDMIKEKPLLGYGVCSARSEFVERGMSDDDFYNRYANPLVSYLKSRNLKVDLSIMHPHNAFLETWAQFGIIGLVLLIGCLISPFAMRLKKNQLFLNLCIYVFLMQSFFESMGSNLQPMYLCLMVLLWNSHQINASRKNTQIQLA